MTHLTRKAIIETTLALAEKKPINRITVRDIVEACNITRNTFYYHFQDIYDVVGEAVSNTVEEVVKTDISSEQKLFTLIRVAIDNRKLLMNLYHALGYERMAGYLIKVIKDVLTEYVAESTEKDAISEIDKEILLTFYEEALAGTLMRWVTSRRIQSDEEIEIMVKRITVLFQGQVPLLMENIKNHPENTEKQP